MTEPPLALILHSPYYSIKTAIGGLRFGCKIFRHIIKNHFDSASLIRRIKGPILIIHGEKDKLIPIEQAKNLFKEINPDLINSGKAKFEKRPKA
jgi:uncharacterized protein